MSKGVYSAPPNYPQTYADDVRFEEQPTVEQIYLGGLDEKTIKDGGTKTIKIAIKKCPIMPTGSRT